MRRKTLLILVLSVMGLINLAGLINYVPMITWNFGYLTQLFLLTLCILYFQFRSVRVGSISISLSLSVYIPIILLYGIGESMLVSIIVAFIYNRILKRRRNRIFLNSMQRAFSALITGQVFLLLGGEIGNLTVPQSILPALIASICYNLVNLGSVISISLLLGTLSKEGAQRFIKSNLHALTSTVLFAYTGVLFSLVIATWQIHGLILFTVLILGFSETLLHGARYSEEQSLRIQVEQELLLDSKTKVYNYRYLRTWLEKSELSEPLAVLFIDIDDFKIFNDQYGHERGDVALMNVATAISNSVRKKDRVVRFGGEEFVVLLPNLGVHQALETISIIQENLKGIPEASMEYPITVSIGVATCPDDSQDLHELLRMADMAMYHAKQSGKDQSCIFNKQICTKMDTG